jgi:hypothetical protein
MMQQYHPLGRGEGGARGGGRWGRDHDNGVRAVEPITSGPRVCSFFASDKGCKNGTACKFLHDIAATAAPCNNSLNNQFGHPPKNNGAGMPRRPNNNNDVGVYAAMGRQNNMVREGQEQLRQHSTPPIFVSPQVEVVQSISATSTHGDKFNEGYQLSLSTFSPANNDAPVAANAKYGEGMTTTNSGGILAGIVAAQRGDVAMAEVFKRTSLTGSSTNSAAADATAIQLDNDVMTAGLSTVNVKIEQTNTTTSELGNANYVGNAALLTDSSLPPTSMNGEGKSLISMKNMTLPLEEHSPLSKIRHIDSSLVSSSSEGKTTRLMSKKTSLPLPPTPPTKKKCSKYSSPSDLPSTFAIPTNTMKSSNESSSLDMASKSSNESSSLDMASNILRNGKRVYARKDVLSVDYYPGKIESHNVIETEKELKHVVYNVRFKDGDLVENIVESFIMSRNAYKKLNPPTSVPTVGGDEAGERKLSAAKDIDGTDPSPLTDCNSTQSTSSSPSKFAKADSTFAKAEGLPDGWVVRSDTNKGGRIVKMYISPIKSFKFQSKKQALRFVEILQNENVNGDEKAAKKLLTEMKATNVKKSTTNNSSLTSNKTLIVPSDKSELSITENRECDDITPASGLLSVQKRFKCKMGDCQKWNDVEGYCESHDVSTTKTSTMKKIKSTDTISPRPSKKQKDVHVDDDQPPAEPSKSVLNSVQNNDDGLQALLKRNNQDYRRSVQPAVQAMIEAEEVEEERQVNQSAMVIKINDDESLNFSENNVANADEFMHIYDDVVTKLTSARADDNSTAIAFYDHLTSYFITKMNYGDFCLGFDKDFII